MGKNSRAAEPEAAAEGASRSKRTRRAAAAATATEPQLLAREPTGDSSKQKKQATASKGGKPGKGTAAADPAGGGVAAASRGAAAKQRRRKAPAGKAAAESAPPEAAAVVAAAAAVSGGKAAGKRKAAAGSGAVAKEKPPYYLVKSEPDEFSINALKGRPNQTEGWEGVRNYVARKHLCGMKVGDHAFFYHSSCKVPGIVGIVEVVREAYPDLTAQDSSSKYHDAKATPDNPRWFMVDFKLVRELRRQITLEELKGHKEGALSGMALFNTARLSVQPVSKQEWEFVLSLEDKEGAKSSSK